jgi:sulfate adenylyltransferase
VSPSEPVGLIPPYGGVLVDLLVPETERPELAAYAGSLPSVQISDRTVCDLELLATGGFSPLDRFMSEEDSRTSIETMRLANGYLSPIPVTLPVSTEGRIREGMEIALRDAHNQILAVMRVEQAYPWDRAEMASKVLGTQDPRHPLVAEMSRWGPTNLSGPLRVVALPVHHDFKDIRLTPQQTRTLLAACGRSNVVAFQTRNPLHRVHEELIKRASDRMNAAILLHPVVGMTKPGDVDHFTRVRTYRALASKYFEKDRIVLALLPLAMRLAGPREALWHALIRRNYGANYLIVGRDHASPGVDSQGRPFYGAYDAQELVGHYSGELGMGVIPFANMVYLPDEGRYVEADDAPPGAKTASISGTEVRDEYLNRGRLLPSWFTRQEVAEILAETYPPRHRQGFCVWFTGLSGAGKSTTADVLTVLLQEAGRPVSVLDGDVVRTHLSKGLGFGREDRDVNIRRIGFVASEIVRHGGAVVCAAVSPYRATRNDVRNMIGSDRFLEVFVNTPIGVCEQRDTKGLYARARRGELREFTGIDDPYEPPEHPEIELDTVTFSAEENARAILGVILARGFVRGT